MSVCTKSQGWWQELFNSLVYYHTLNNIDSQIKFLDYAEIERTARIYKKDIEQVEIDEIYTMVFQLYLANELCFAYAYNLSREKSATIEPLQLKVPLLNPIVSPETVCWDIGKLVKEISHIRYNCISNGGSYFIPKNIEDKLDNILSRCAWILAERE